VSLCIQCQTVLAKPTIAATPRYMEAVGTPYQPGDASYITKRQSYRCVLCEAHWLRDQIVLGVVWKLVDR
jgi:hypothetical protein